MNVRLFLLERWLPGWARRRILGALAHLAADAFGTEPPSLARLGQYEAAGAFASFTRTEVDRVLASESAATAQAIRVRLHERARDAGQAAARHLGVATRADAFRAFRLLYRGIGIDMEIDCSTGGIAVRRCLFSGFYTPAVCAFISALDAGFLCGLTGGGTLAFSERITDGAPCCRAHVSGGTLR